MGFKASFDGTVFLWAGLKDEGDDSDSSSGGEADDEDEDDGVCRTEAVKPTPKSKARAMKMARPANYKVVKAKKKDNMKSGGSKSGGSKSGGSKSAGSKSK